MPFGCRRQLRLSLQRIIQVSTNALKLRRPSHERILVIVVQHVAHRQPELIQVVLDAQQLQRIPAVSIDQLALEHAQARDLPIDVHRVGDDGGERQNQTE